MTETHIYESDWLNQPALTLETDVIRVVTVPFMGGKIVSVYDKIAQHEWVLPPHKNRRFEPVEYGSVFTDQDMSGWDECFPTINACHYPIDGEYKGNVLPDHGEVWSLPWQIEHQQSDSLTLSVKGRALPYIFSRRMLFTDAQTLCLKYTVTNTGKSPFYALWAAHPQFRASEHTQIVLPSSIEQVMNVFPSESWGSVGARHKWHMATTDDDRLVDPSRIGSADRHQARKFYTLPEEPIDWAEIHQLDKNTTMRLSWNHSDVPYLGIWVDEGLINPSATFALEPTTGFYDDLSSAIKNGRVPQLQPDQTMRWQLNISIRHDTMRL